MAGSTGRLEIKRVSANPALAKKIAWLILLISLGANLFVVISLSSFYIPLLNDPNWKFVKEHQNSNFFHYYFSISTSILSFLIPSIFIIQYIIPIIKAISDPSVEKFFLIGKIRCINQPLIVSSYSFIGWMIGWLETFGHYYLSNIPLNFENILYSFILVIILAVSCFTIVYYSLDYISKKYLVSFFYPDNMITGQKGVFYLSIRWKFFILISSTTLTAILLLYNIILRLFPKAILQEIIISVTIIILVVLLISYFLGYQLSESFRKPLQEMKTAADEIEKGNFQINIGIRSADELGILAESINQMAIGLQEKEFIKDTFGKAVDPNVRDYLLDGNIELGGQIKQAAILFSDIRGFTSYSETRKPDEVVQILNRYLERMSHCIIKNKGTINKYIGDAIMAVFNIPIEINHYHDAAFQAAQDMLAELVILNSEFSDEGHQPIHIGIGLHSGNVLAGNIGSSYRLEYTIIGDSVNLASRLEGLTKQYNTPLILSEHFYKQLSEKERLQRIDRVTVKGRREGLDIYGLL